MKIIITESDGEYKATIEDQTDLRGYGDSSAEALGNLILNHQSKFSDISSIEDLT